MTRLKCSDTGEWINLGKEISKSGEGRIYQTSKAGFLAKIYHTITQEQIDKLQVMVKNPPVDPTRAQGHVSIAWPRCLLQDSYGKSLGFLMPAIGNGQTLINVYNPARREKNAAGFNWFYLHTTAMNIASIVQAIHKNSYVVGDLKPDNLLVTPNAYVSIIDTDSFQIVDRRTRKIYRCPVASQEFTPREMFGKDLQKVDRSDFQDGFALGVIIWQLLFGYHPFSGDFSGSGNQPNIDQLIEQGWWMYGSSSQLRPGKLSMPLNIIHPELQQLFRKCFNDGHNKPNARPSAADWETALRQAISELTQCSVESGHHYAKSYGKCYWCERKRQLNGYDMFASPPGTPKPPVSPGANKNPIKQQVQPVKPVVIPVKPSPVKHPQSPNKIKTLIGAGAVMLTLSAIALPSFTNQANKAKQSEAKQYIGSMNRAQQALFADKASFATNIGDLKLGIKEETNNYKYNISKLLKDSVVVAVAEQKQSSLKGYVGIVLATKQDMKSLLCEQSQASTSLPDLSTIVNKKSQGDNVVQCPAGYEALAGSPQSVTQSSSPQLSPKQQVRSQTNSSIPSVSDERVNFDKGSTEATIHDSATANRRKRYLLNCGSGQRMTLQISQGNINMAIIAPNGQKIGNAVNGAPQWQGELPSEGDYIIEVSAFNQSDYTINIEVLPSNTPVSSTPEQTLKNFYELTVKDNKAAGKKFTTDTFRNKYTPTDADNQKTWVSTFSSIEVTQTEPIEKSATGAKMTAWLRYSYKDGSPQKCGYRDFTFVLTNNIYLIDNDGEEIYIPCY